MYIYVLENLTEYNQINYKNDIEIDTEAIEKRFRNHSKQNTQKTLKLSATILQFSRFWFRFWNHLLQYFRLGTVN